MLTYHFFHLTFIRILAALTAGNDAILQRHTAANHGTGYARKGLPH